MSLHSVFNTSVLIALLFSQPALADVQSDTRSIEQRWAEVTYQTQGSRQIKAFDQLNSEAEQLVAKYPRSAESWLWSGIIKSTYAGVKGGLGALKLAKLSKAALEKAISLDANVMNGSAYTSLGALYFNVPGWPISFGDDDKAEQFLQRALTINPRGIDSNFFYADYLIHEKRYKEAKTFLMKALAAPSRPSRPLADAGRQREINERLSRVEAKLRK